MQVSDPWGYEKPEIETSNGNWTYSLGEVRKRMWNPVTITELQLFFFFVFDAVRTDMCEGDEPKNGSYIPIGWKRQDETQNFIAKRKSRDESSRGLYLFNSSAMLYFHILWVNLTILCIFNIAYKTVKSVIYRM